MYTDSMRQIKKEKDIQRHSPHITAGSEMVDRVTDAGVK
jgi:hypothetical protein